MKNTIIISTAFAVISALAVAACGSSSSSSGTGSSGPCGDNTTTSSGNQACSDCISSKCSGQISDSQSACSDYVSCLNGCGCTTACSMMCQSSISSDCQSAQNAIVSCISTSCPSECGFGTTTGSNTTASTGSGGATCADLDACCAQVTDMQLKSGCDQTVSAGNDANCSSVLNAYKGAGYCM